MALLVIAVLVTGVVFAVIRQPDGGRKAQPSPTPPTASPTVEPTMEPTEEPTEEPTDEPTTEPPDDGGVVGPGRDGRVPLAETGGPVAPWLLSGSLLIGLAAALWRFSRVR